MRKEKIWFLVLFLFLMVGMIGCNGGSSSGGSSSTTTPTTTTTTPTDPLVGTWKAADGGASLTFIAGGSGSMSDGHTISGWTLSSTNILTMTLTSPETFQLTWLNTAKTSMSLHNLSPSDETTIYNKSS